MASIVRSSSLAVCAGVVLALAVSPARPGSHLWVIHEVYSNADGTVQFVEMWCPTPNENSIAGKSIHADGGSSDPFDANLPAGSTADEHLLAATAAFAALPGAPAPDLILPAGFVDTSGDTIQWHVYAASILSFGAGELPTDGVQSLNDDGSVGPATPTNFAGETFAPPAVDGLAAAKVPGFPDGSRLSVSWAEAACLGGGQFHLVYGFGTDLPDSLGGVYALQPPLLGQCNVAGSPMFWSGVPDPATDATRFLWFLVLADDGATEGSWGTDSAGGERTGPMIGGASGQCGVFVKDVTNTCP